MYAQLGRSNVADIYIHIHAPAHYLRHGNHLFSYLLYPIYIVQPLSTCKQENKLTFWLIPVDIVDARRAEVHS